MAKKLNMPGETATLFSRDVVSTIAASSLSLALIDLLVKNL